MARTITAITQAHAVAICRRGSNPEARVLIRKTADTPSSSSSEEPTMSIKKILAFNALSDVAKAHIATLSEADADSFLEKTTDEQGEILKAAGKMPDDKKDDEKGKKVAKTGDAAAGDQTTDEVNKNDPAAGAGEMIAKSAVESMIAAAVEPLKKTIEDLEGRGVDHELEKTAAGADYKGYPGGATEVVKVLKSVQGQPEAVVKAVTDGLKATALNGRLFADTAGVHVQKDIEGTTANDIEKQAQDILKADTTGAMTIDIARGQVLAASPELLSKALAEEEALQSA
jgi:hypothetical protein